MDMIGWMAAFVILIGIEAATMALTTIWFAGGAVAAFLAAVLGVSVQVQLVVFLIVSFILLLFTRPLAMRFVNRETVKTNVNGLIGRRAKVIAKIDNNDPSGAAVIDGQEWTARSADDAVTIPGRDSCPDQRGPGRKTYRGADPRYGKIRMTQVTVRMLNGYRPGKHQNGR